MKKSGQICKPLASILVINPTQIWTRTTRKEKNHWKKKLKRNQKNNEKV
ncbi:hypothetical protein ACJIZ3_015328 [Penstemon smallii]|uniref:Uncharacterized protein n=1 Tax=Penstemon smallii TaxID=265156 RepID=A0ABD3RMC2_9LAMI